MRSVPLALLVACLTCACAQRSPSIARTTSAEGGASATATPSQGPVPSASASAAPPLDAGRARVYAKAQRVPILAEPDPRGRGLGKPWIGQIAAGGSVPLANREAVRPAPDAGARSCPSWVAVEPRGFVCVDGERATLDEADPIVTRLAQHRPDLSSPWPYQYGESRGSRRHKVLPGSQEQAWPPFVHDPRDAIAARSTVAWLDELEAPGGPWLRTSDLAFVKKSRVEAFPRVSFHGTKIGDGASLPLAFFRELPRPKYRREDSGKMVQEDESWARLSWVGLTGKTEKVDGALFHETKDNGRWVLGPDAVVVKREVPPPPGARSWVEVAALKGFLVAYEGEQPVYATLISAGKLGAVEAHEGREQPAATTPVGTFRVRVKHVTTTLVSDLDDGTEYLHAEVPWSQTFYDKYLLHTAYWHDDWGEGRSGGCVNLSPVDAKWLFEWTEPRMPDGWHSVRVPDEEPATAVVVHR